MKRIIISDEEKRRIYNLYYLMESNESIDLHNVFKVKQMKNWDDTLSDNLESTNANEFCNGCKIRLAFNDYSHPGKIAIYVNFNDSAVDEFIDGLYIYLQPKKGNNEILRSTYDKLLKLLRLLNPLDLNSISSIVKIDPWTEKMINMLRTNKTPKYPVYGSIGIGLECANEEVKKDTLQFKYLAKHSSDNSPKEYIYLAPNYTAGSELGGNFYTYKIENNDITFEPLKFKEKSVGRYNNLNVRIFQSIYNYFSNPSNPILVDGIVGRQTTKAFNEVMKNKISDESSNSINKVLKETYKLALEELSNVIINKKFNIKNINHTRALQVLLYFAGGFDIIPDGIIGPITKREMKKLLGTDDIIKMDGNLITNLINKLKDKAIEFLNVLDLTFKV